MWIVGNRFNYCLCYPGIYLKSHLITLGHKWLLVIGYFDANLREFNRHLAEFPIQVPNWFVTSFPNSSKTFSPRNLAIKSFELHRRVSQMNKKISDKLFSFYLKDFRKFSFQTTQFSIEKLCRNCVEQVSFSSLLLSFCAFISTQSQMNGKRFSL